MDGGVVIKKEQDGADANRKRAVDDSGNDDGKGGQSAKRAKVEVATGTPPPSSSSDPPKIASAKAAIEADPYDIDAWGILLQYMQHTNIAAVRYLYDKLFEYFPTAAHVWRAYVDSEMAAGNLENVEAIFKKCLISCPDIELFKSYLKYIRLKYIGAVDEAVAIEKAFEFALDKIGDDVGALPVWKGFIEHLTSIPTTNEFEEAQKRKKIREVYQKGVVVPMHAVDALWRDYDVFENNISKTLAKPLLQEWKPKHIISKGVSMERSKRLEGIQKYLLPRPPRENVAANGGQQREREYTQVHLWLRFIRYEKSNQSRLEPSLLKQRIAFTYKQCLLCLRHYPDIWLSFAMYMHENGGPDQAVAVFKEAIAAMPYSVFMHFLYAEYEEERKNIKEAKAIYESLLISEKKTASKKQVAAAAAAAAAGPSDSSASVSPDAGDATGLGIANGNESGLMTETHPLVYVQLLKFIRRTEGTDAARKAFIMARKSSTVTWHCYVAAALMEFHQNHQPDIAAKIFSFGMKTFESNFDFIFSYLDFLNSINDHANLRIVIERVLKQTTEDASQGLLVTGDRAKSLHQLWERYLDFETHVADTLTSIKRAQLRRNVETGIATTGQDADEAMPIFKKGGLGGGGSGDNSSSAAGGGSGSGGGGGANASSTSSSSSTASAERSSVLSTLLSISKGLFIWDHVDRLMYKDLLPCSSVYRDAILAHKSEKLGILATGDASDVASSELDRVANVYTAGDNGKVVDRLCLRAMPLKQAKKAKSKYVHPNLSLMQEYNPRLGPPRLDSSNGDGGSGGADGATVGGGGAAGAASLLKVRVYGGQSLSEPLWNLLNRLPATFTGPPAPLNPLYHLYGPVPAPPSLLAFNRERFASLTRDMAAVDWALQGL